MMLCFLYDVEREEKRDHFKNVCLGVCNLSHCTIAGALLKCLIWCHLRTCETFCKYYH